MLNAVLFAAFALGHAAVWVVVINYLYALPWPRPLLKTCRLLTGVIIVGLPAVALWADGLALSDRTPLLVYQAACAAFGGVVLPAVTLWRQLRPRPGAVLSETHEIIDVAAALGRKPAIGKRAWQAKLPLNQVFRVDLTRLELAIPGLPAALDGLTILHVSDLHFHGTPDREFYEYVFDRLGELGTPDMLALTGDFIDTDGHLDWVKPLLGRLSWNEAALAILGNHDRWHHPDKIRSTLKDAGCRVVGNGVEAIEIRGERVVFAGNEELWFRPAPELNDAPAGFRIGLSHTPDNVGWAKRNGIALLLCGHVHGGQIRVPGFGSIFVPSRYSRRYDQGTFHEVPTVMHVNRGLGGKSPLRFFCKPQVTWLTLRAGRGS